MSVLNLTVLAENAAVEEQWARELGEALRALPGVMIRGGSTGGAELGQVVFVDSAMRGLDAALVRVDRRQRAVILLVRDGARVPEALRSGKVDDVLVHPFRPVEVLSKLQHYRQILLWDEVADLNASFSELIQGLRDDLKLAERLQKGRLPTRFPEVKGFRAASRYLAGMRSGGDHFDLAESKDGSQLSIVLSDSSSYGLSSAVLSALMRVAVKLSVEEARSSRETVRRIHEELAATLGEKDRLSLFYGVVSRKDYRLRYVNLGSSSAFRAAAGSREFTALPTQGEAISRGNAFAATAAEAELALQPGDRLVLVSDGFVDAAGGADSVRRLLGELRSGEAADVLNELVFRVKSKFQEPDDMPEQDCTGVVLDVDTKVLRLA